MTNDGYRIIRNRQPFTKDIVEQFQNTRYRQRARR